MFEVVARLLSHIAIASYNVAAGNETRGNCQNGACRLKSHGGESITVACFAVSERLGTGDDKCCVVRLNGRSIVYHPVLLSTRFCATWPKYSNAIIECGISRLSASPMAFTLVRCNASAH